MYVMWMTNCMDMTQSLLSEHIRRRTEHFWLIWVPTITLWLYTCLLCMWISICLYHMQYAWGLNNVSADWCQTASSHCMTCLHRYSHAVLKLRIYISYIVQYKLSYIIWYIGQPCGYRCPGVSDTRASVASGLTLVGCHISWLTHNWHRTSVVIIMKQYSIRVLSIKPCFVTWLDH